MFDNENPYQSPVVSGNGEYDWTLARQAFVAVVLVLLMWLIPAAVGSWEVCKFRSRNICGGDNPIEVLVSIIKDTGH